MRPVTFFFNRTVQGMPYVRFESQEDFIFRDGFLSFRNNEGQYVVVNESNIPYRVFDK